MTDCTPNMRTRRPFARRAAWIVIAGCLVVGSSCLFSFDREPSYNGKPLSFWLDHVSVLAVHERYPGAGFENLAWESLHDLRVMDLSPAEQGFVAIDTIGTNCVPQILRRLQSRSRKHLPFEVTLRRTAIRLGFPYSNPYIGHMQTLTAIAVLGAKAEKTVPDLTKLTNSTAPMVADLARFALARIEYQKNLQPASP